MCPTLSVDERERETTSSSRLVLQGPKTTTSAPGEHTADPWNRDKEPVDVISYRAYPNAQQGPHQPQTENAKEVLRGERGRSVERGQQRMQIAAADPPHDELNHHPSATNMHYQVG